MSTYAIGDVQGCARTLDALIETIGPGPDDRIWFCGDLVNRGPDSRGVLERVRALGPRAVAVLGNHDLRLLACAEGLLVPREKDTLRDVLEAPDGDACVQWLAHRPLVHEEGEDLLLHAGLLPAWTLEDVRTGAAAAQERLRGPGRRALLQRLVERKPVDAPPRDEDEWAEIFARVVTNLRVVDAHGRPDFRWTVPPDELPADRFPWYDAPGRRPLGRRIVCGHWAAQGVVRRPDLVALDSACVWGGTLTALRLEDGRLFSTALQDDVAPWVRIHARNAPRTDLAAHRSDDAPHPGSDPDQKSV